MDYLGIATVIGGIAAFIITYFDKREETLNLLKQKYFDRVLCVYYCKYRKNSNINSVNFIKRNFEGNETFIPKYIFYLCDEKNKEDLNKILLVDYWKYYPNKTNVFNKSINGLFDKGHIFEVFLSISMICLGGMLIMLFIIQLILSTITVLKGNLPFYEIANELSSNDAWTGLCYGILALILEIIYHTSISKTFNNKDEYSLNINRIKEFIKKKKKIYDDSNSKYYL